MTQLRKAVLTGCLPKMRDFQCSATTVLSGECTEFQRKRGERESSLGVAPHAQSPEVRRSEGENGHSKALRVRRRKGRVRPLAEGVILQSNLLYLTPLYRKNPKALQEELPKIFALRPITTSQREARAIP